MDNVKQSLTDTTIFMGKKTKDAMDKTKLELQILNHKRHIQNKYKELGKVIYQIKMGTLKDEHEEKIEDICTEITTRKNYIKKLKQKEEIQGLQEEELLQNNQNKAVEGQINLFDVPKPEKNTEGLLLMKFCPECQVGNHPEATRCISCGANFN